MTINSKKISTTNSQDTDKETCIDEQIESAAVLSSSNDDMTFDSYSSDFHFIKKFDSNGNFILM